MPTEVVKLAEAATGSHQVPDASHRAKPEKFVEIPTFWIKWFSIQENGQYLKLNRPWLIHPTSAFSLWWTTAGIFFIVLCLVFIPFQLAFDYEADIHGTLSQKFWSITLPIMDAYFLMDIVVNFNTCYYVDDELHQDRSDLAKKYLTGWFLIDFSSTGSTFVVLLSSAPGLSLLRNLRMLRLLRLLKLFRILKLGKMIAMLEQHSDEIKVFINYLKICGPTFIWTHLLACAWHSIGESKRDDARTWLLMYHGDHSYRDLQIEQNYLTSLYWAFVTVTTVGYGDITPQNDAERFFCVCATFVGTAVFAFIIGEIQAMVTKKKFYAIEFEHKMESVEEFMRHHKFPRMLRQKVRHHYTCIWDRQILFNEDSILDDLPFAIRQDVAIFLRRDLILKVPFLRNAPLNMVFDLVSRLHLLVVGAGSIIIEVGDNGREMFIIDKGEVEVTLPTKTLSLLSEHLPGATVTLGEGDFFGEKALLQHCVRTATVKATRACELLVLHATDLGDVLEKNPVFAKHVIESLRLRDREQGDVGEEQYKSVTLWQAKKIVRNLQRGGEASQDLMESSMEESRDEDDSEAGESKRKVPHNVLVSWEEFSDVEDDDEDVDEEEQKEEAQDSSELDGNPQQGGADVPEPPEISPKEKSRELAATLKNEALQQKITHLQEELQLLQRQQKRTEAVQQEQIEQMMELLRKEGVPTG